MVQEIPAINKEDNTIYFNANNQYITLLVDNEIVFNEFFKGKDQFWISHPVLKNKDISRIKLYADYFGHKGKYKSNLHFLHNPRCAGTSIENLGYEFGIKWGSFDESINSHPFFSFPWHKPLSYYSKEELNGKEIFTVVRNPYTRLLSIFKYLYQNSLSNPSSKFIVSDINNFINNIIDQYPSQYEFVYYNEKKITNHILYFENITQDFNALMYSKSLPLRLDKKLNTTDNNIINKNYMLDILYKDTTIKNFYQKYNKDFYFFNYKYL